MSRTEWRVCARDKALKYIDSLSNRDSLRIWNALARALDFLDEKNSFENIGLKVLHGEVKGLFRLRVGKWRVILEIRHKDKVIELLEVDTRGDVYK